MFDRDQRKQLWIMVAGAIVEILGVAVMVVWSQFVGVSVVLIGSLTLGVASLKIVAASNLNQRMQLWTMLAGLGLVNVGLLFSVFSIYSAGSVVSLIGVMMLFVGGVIIPGTLKHIKSK